MEQATYRAVVGLVFTTAKDQVTLIRKNRPEDQRHRLNGIGGTCIKDEHYLSTMRRKAIEEAGYEGLEWKLYGFKRGPIVKQVGSVEIQDGFYEIAYFSAFTNDTPRTRTDEHVLQYPLYALNGLHIVEDLRYMIPAALQETVCLLEVLSK